MSIRRNDPLVLLGACLTALLLPTSITGTAVTLPSIVNDLGGSVVQLQWIVHSYDLTFASFMLALGSLSDIYGRRSVFRFGILTYGACALAASLGQSLLFLDVVRGVTGIAAAAVMTSAAAAIAQNFEGPAQARAFGLFGTSFGIGLAFGPMMGGGLATAFGWRAFFAGQVVLALAAFACSHRMPGRVSGSSARIDWPGSVAFVSAGFAFILALVQAPQRGLSDPAVLGLFAVAAVLGVVFAINEAKSDHPMFDLTLLRQGRYFAVCAAPIALAFGFVALLVYLPTYLMTAHTMSAWDAGLFMMALTLPTLYMPAIAGSLVARGASPRWLMVLCMAMVAAGCFWLTAVDHTTGLVATAAPLFFIGTGFGISNGILDAAAATSVEPARAGMAVGMFNTMRIAGEVVAIAVVGSLVVGYQRSYFERDALPSGLSPQTLANGITEGRLDQLLRQVTAGAHDDVLATALRGLDHAMHWSYVWIGVLCALTVPLIAVLMRPAASAAPPTTQDDLREPVQA